MINLKIEHRGCNMDIFKEQLVKQKMTSKSKMMNVGVILLGIIITLGSMLIMPGFMPVVLVVVIFVGALIIAQTKKEHEYTAT